jgi:hypothetical protein
VSHDRSKDGYVIQPSERHKIIEDKETETYKLVVCSVSVEDAGLYTVSATNECGEASMQARLAVHSQYLLLFIFLPWIS